MSDQPSNPIDPDSLALSKQEGTRENETESRRSQLSSRQILALPVLAVAPSIRQAAEETGVGESTLHRWLRDERFQSEFRRLTAEAAELTRQELRKLTLRSVEVLTDLMEHPDPTVRLRAAHYATSLGVQAINLDNLRKDTQEPRTEADALSSAYAE